MSALPSWVDSGFNLVLRFQSWYAVKAPLIDHIWMRCVRRSCPVSALRINFENRTLCWINMGIMFQRPSLWIRFSDSIWTLNSISLNHSQVAALRAATTRWTFTTTSTYFTFFLRGDRGRSLSLLLCLLAVCRYGAGEGARHVRLSAAYYYAARLLVEWILGGGRGRAGKNVALLQFGIMISNIEKEQ